MRNWKKVLAVLAAIALQASMVTPAFALPHHNRSDVAEWVKVFIPVQAMSVDAGVASGSIAITPHADSAGTPAGSVSTVGITISVAAGTIVDTVGFDASGNFVAATTGGTINATWASAPTFTGSTMGTHSHASTAAFTGSGTVLAAVGTGDAPVNEVNSLGFTGIQMEAAGDDAHMLIPVPDNMDINSPMKISVAWSTADTTTTDTATWKILYNPIDEGEALAAASTACDTAITADAVDNTAYGFQESPKCTIAGHKMDKGDLLHILAELDAVSGLNPASSATFFHGVFIEYVREKL